jgi:hypothetical protein
MPLLLRYSLTMRRCLALAALTLSLTACPATRPVEGPQPMLLLAQETYSAAKEPRREVLRDPTTWQSLWSELQLARRIAPPFDFDRQMVLFVALGERRTGGYAIEVVRAEIVEGKLVVHVREIKPQPGALTTMALTAPFHAVAVPRHDLPVSWFTVP